MSINVKPYQARWAGAFEEEARRLKTVFAPLSADFYHIGSTSISGCSAKPILDILGVVADVTVVDDYNGSLSQLGFEPLGEYGMKQRRFFRKRSGTHVNLHIFEDTDPEVERHLRFCDYLRRHPTVIRVYSELKIELAEQFPQDIQGYTLGKVKFIKEIDILAALEADHFLCPPLKNPQRKSQWSLSETIAAMEANKHLHMTCFTKYIPAIQRVFEPDVTVVRKGNVAMYLDLDHFIPPETVSTLQFVRAATTSHLQSFSQVVVAVGEDPKAFDQLYSKIPPILYKQGSNLKMTIAYADGVAVGIGILLLHANVAGLYYIATVPAEQKKGYGTAMMVYLLKRAKERGFHRAVLQASAAGKSLYERLGFQECCFFKEYS